MRNLLLGLTVVLSSVLCAEEIVFTGADTANPTNLSSAANWSAAPSADAIGVIDLSKTTATKYVVEGAGLSLKGLRIEGAAGTTITLGGSAVLTIGEAGYVSTGNNSLTLRCPLAIAAPQTWDLGEGTNFVTYSSISGTDDLCISNFAQYVVHYATVGYGGKITYCRSSSHWENKWVEYCGEGKWADAVHIASAMPLNLRPDNGKTVKWKDVFPVSNPTIASSSANIGLNVSKYPTGGTVVFEEGADLSFATDGTTPYYLTLAGHFRQTGGSIVKRQQYYLTLGHHAQDRSWSYEKPALYSMEGGTLNVSSILIAYTAQDSYAEGNRFVQTGGTVTLPYTGNGANLQIGGGSSKNYTIAEYQMNGGTLNLGGYGGSYNLAIASPRVNNTVMPAAGFIMTGGTANSRCLTFGSDMVFWNSALNKMKDAYALLDLSGGMLSFYGTYDGSNKEMVSWLHFCKSWNCDPANTNCFYSVKLHGGTLNISSEGLEDWPLQTCFPKTEVGTVLGNKDRNLTIPAPVYGTGIIRKEGTGGLFLSDATRFTGTLDVRGGVVSVEGLTDDIASSDVGCFRWTADSLAATHDADDPVTSWMDSNNGIVAMTNGNPAVERGNFIAPVFKPDVYNGHAALKFTRSSLAVPMSANPLYGKKSCTVVAVFKTDSNGGYHTVAYGNALLSVFPGSTHSVFGVGLVSDSGREGGGSRFGVIRRFGGDPDASHSTYASRSGVTLNDGDIHAVAITLDEKKVTFTVDADYTSTNYTGTADLSPIGYINKNWTDNKRGELLIGGHIVANDSAVDGSAPFKGDLMEIRVYTNHLFTAAEQRQITKKMLQVYDGSAARMAKLESGANATGMGAPGVFSSWTPNEPVAADASWDADTIELEDGESVAEWISEDKSRKVTAEVAGMTAPVLVKNAINGHSAVRFNSSSMTGLGLAAGSSPVNGVSDFTVAIVWRSDSSGKSYNDFIGHDYSAAGLISTKQSTKSADFSLSYRPGSAVMAGYGHSKANQSMSTRKPYRLNDGEVHISVFSCSGTDGKYELMTDGMFLSGTLNNVSARGAFDVMFGTYLAKATSSVSCFDGDIAAVKLYGSALTKEQMRNLGEYWAKRYATQLLTGHRHSAETLREKGLGATNILVAADARLSLPLTDDTPFTLAPGARLSGAGSFMGSYRFASGSQFDITDCAPASFDDLQMYGGSIVVDRANLGTSTLHVRRLKTEGVNIVSLEGADELPYKKVLFTFDEADVAENTSWIVKGAKTTLSSVVIDADAGCATLVTRRGFVLSVR